MVVWGNIHRALVIQLSEQVLRDAPLSPRLSVSSMPPTLTTISGKLPTLNGEGGVLELHLFTSLQSRM